MDKIKDPNRCVVNGTVYVAKNTVLRRDGSKRCSETCDAYKDCLTAKQCLPEFRPDRRNIVWKRVKKEDHNG